jgi:hypothetical protein
VTALVVEVFFSRMGFMLASRSGQLRDLRFAMLIAAGGVDPAKLEAVARSLMLLRRDAAALKVVDVEALASMLPKYPK